MSWIQKIIKSWKTEFDVSRKRKSFLKGLANAPDLIGNPPLIEGDEVSFSHSGHSGDVMYSLPAMYALAKGRKINLYLRLHQPATEFTRGMTHPNGKLMLNEKSVEMFRPLMLQQPQINRFKALENETVHYDLSVFKAFPFDYRMSSLTRYYFLTFGVTADLSKPWLHVTPNESFRDKIVIARSSRYRSPQIDYGFLKKYEGLVFAGLPDEYADMKQHIPNLEYRPVKNFLELAEMIAGCRMFIGNQSFPFSLAEALKVPRILEVFHMSPNVIPEGPNTAIFSYQPQFEKLAEEMLGTTNT